MMQIDPLHEHHAADADESELAPVCPLARSILDAVRARIEWESRQRSRAESPPHVRPSE